MRDKLHTSHMPLDIKTLEEALFPKYSKTFDYNRTLAEFGYNHAGDESGIVLIGYEPIGSYITVTENLLKESKDVTILSRGRLNSLALDICNVIQNKGYGKIKELKTRTVTNPMDNKRVSVLEVYIKPDSEGIRKATQNEVKIL